MMHSSSARDAGDQNRRKIFSVVISDWEQNIPNALFHQIYCNKVNQPQNIQGHFKSALRQCNNGAQEYAAVFIHPEWRAYLHVFKHKQQLTDLRFMPEIFIKGSDTW